MSVSHDMSYGPAAVTVWASVTRRQLPKDLALIHCLETYLVGERILEIGAGCGQLTAILRSRGWKVIGSDVSPAFVEYMNSRNIPAKKLDALQLDGEIRDTIFCQGLSTLITRDKQTIRKTYQTVYRHLRDGGRFIFIFPNAYGSRRWSTIADHIETSTSEGFTQVALTRNQVLPARFYGGLVSSVAGVLERSLGPYFGTRWQLVLER